MEQLLIIDRCCKLYLYKVLTKESIFIEGIIEKEKRDYFPFHPLTPPYVRFSYRAFPQCSSLTVLKPPSYLPARHTTKKGCLN